MPIPTRFQKHPLTIAIQACCYTMLSGSPLALATPTGGTVVGGTGTISQLGTTTTINQSTQNLAINWQTFDVAANERVQFIQPNSTSVAFNRILSNNGSTIAGRIDANGQVILVNANGIFFTSTAVLNVGSIIASGLDMTPNDFMNGQYVFNEISGTSGAVVNSGLINASLGGNVALIGRRVENNGLIVANLGTVTLAAGKQAVLTFDNGGLLGVRVSQEILQNELGVDPAVLNSGEIQAQGGRVLLTASQSQDVFSQAVNTNGMEPATSVVMNDDGTFTLGAGADVVNSGAINVSTTSADQGTGRIVLIGENVTSSGSLRADAASGNGGEIELHARDMTLLTLNSITTARSESNGNGGIVKVLGDKAGLFDQSMVDVSGAKGGGQVLIGGDFQGSNSNIRNASRTYVSAGSAIYADAFQQGNGGKIINWGNDYTWFYGNAFARGGSISGDGGLVEISGKGLTFNGSVDTSAQNGTVGTVLFDPMDIVIHNAPYTGPSDNNELNGDDQILATDGGTGTTFNISEDRLETISNTSNILLAATNNITINNDVGPLDLRTESGRTVTFIADADSDGSGSFSMNPSDRIQTVGGNVSISGASVTTGRIITNGGDVSLTLRPNSTGSINLGGNITTGGGDASFSGNVLLTSAVTIDTTGGTDGNILFSNTLNSVDDTAAQNLTLDGGNVTFSGAVGSTNRLGALQITSSGNVNASTNAITAGSLVARAIGYTSGAISTLAGGGSVDVSARDIRVGSITSANDVDLRAIDDTSNGTPSIILDGNISAGPGAVSLSLDGRTNPSGSITINYSGDFTSTVNISGSSGQDTLNAANRANAWRITADNEGTLNSNVRFTSFENLNGNSLVDTFTFDRNTSIAGRVDGGDGADRVDMSALDRVDVTLDGVRYRNIEDFVGNGSDSTLRSGNIENDWAINGTNSGTLNDGTPGGITFTGFTDLIGGSDTDNFVFSTLGTLGSAGNSGRVDGGSGADTLRVNVDAVSATTLRTNDFFVGTRGAVDYSSIDDITISGGASIAANDVSIGGTLRLANTGTVTAGGVITANTLVLDNVSAQTGAMGSPLLTNVNNLSILDTGPVYLSNDGNLVLSSINITNPASLIDIVATGTITSNTPLVSNATLTLNSGSNAISLSSTQNSLSGALNLTGGAVELGNSATTNFAAVTASSLTANATADITQTGALNVTGLTTLNAAGRSIELNNSSNSLNTVSISQGAVGGAALVSIQTQGPLAGGFIEADSINLTTVGGIGSLATETALLTVNNTNLAGPTSGGVTISNTGDATVSITNLGDINFTNNGNLTIERLYTNGGLYAVFTPGAPYPDDVPYIGDVNLDVTGSVTAYQGVGSHTAEAAPDIVAENLFVTVSNEFGTSNRYISVRVRDTFTYSGGDGFVYYYGETPTLLGGAPDLTSIDSVGGLSTQQLLDIDSLDEFDPAIFTEVRNYYYEDVAILLPSDQRLDGSDDDEEKDEEKEGKL